MRFTSHVRFLGFFLTITLVTVCGFIPPTARRAFGQEVATVGGSKVRYKMVYKVPSVEHPEGGLILHIVIDEKGCTQEGLEQLGREFQDDFRKERAVSILVFTSKKAAKHWRETFPSDSSHRPKEYNKYQEALCAAYSSDWRKEEAYINFYSGRGYPNNPIHIPLTYKYPPPSRHY